LVETKHLIVGAGAAGLFMAFEMARHGEVDFLLLDRGMDLADRERVTATAPPKEAAKAIVYGVGGAGLFSDGKLNFSWKIGGSIRSVLSTSLYRELTDFAIETFGFDVTPPNTERQEQLEASLFPGADWEFVAVPQVHIGSDHLPDFVRQMTKKFHDKILSNQPVVSIDRVDGRYLVRTEQELFQCERLVIAVGQAGYSFAESIAHQFGLTVRPAPADLGIRVELPSQYWHDLVDVQWDPKIYWRTEGGEVRTFCTNPRGFVVGEFKKGFFSVNGHAKRDSFSDYTNFALMIKMPEERPNEYLVDLCRRIGNATQNRPLIQRVDDFLHDRATTTLGNFRPTCADGVLGNVIPFYPESAVAAYKAVLQGIVRSFPDLDPAEAIIYAPEVKLYSNRIKVQQDTFESELPGLFFLGDCCGHIHGLTNAMLSGLACGRYCAAKAVV
jgi:uncharacterized FAD-dependent dehydrogenase